MARPKYALILFLSTLCISPDKFRFLRNFPNCLSKTNFFFGVKGALILFRLITFTAWWAKFSYPQMAFAIRVINFAGLYCLKGFVSARLEMEIPPPICTEFPISSSSDSVGYWSFLSRSRIFSLRSQYWRNLISSSSRSNSCLLWIWRFFCFSSSFLFWIWICII